MWIALLYLLTATMAQVAESNNNDIICPKGDHKEACYSRHFEPSSEWKIVKEGQMIPPGLEIRMSIDGSGIKEARIAGDDHGMDVSDAEIIPAGDEKIGLDSNSNLEQVLEVSEALKNDGINNYKEQTSFSDREEFKSLSGYIITLGKQRKLSSENFETIVKNLERLAELSSDYEIGSDVSKGRSLESLLALSGISDNSNHKDEFVFSGLGQKEIVKVKDMSLRCLSSALRNNDESLAHLSEAIPDRVSFVTRLISQETNPLLQRRRIGLLGALVTNDEFEQAINNKSVRELLERLGRNSPNELVRERVSNTLSDLANKRGDQAIVKQ